MSELNYWTIDFLDKKNKNVINNILDALYNSFGEIGNLEMEDNELTFEIYEEYYKYAPKKIEVNQNIVLELINKYDDPFYKLGYEIKELY
jgi:hypothetical protein